MEDILVSISCITYNHAKFIRKCFDGFLMQQTNFNFEVLIHDDASTDGTIEIIKEYEKNFPSIFKPIIQDVNQYSQGKRSFNSKYNFSRAKGKYIALCEGDDYWIDPNKLQMQVNFLEANPDYVMCFTNAYVVDKEGVILQEKQIGRLEKDIFLTEDVPFFAPTHTRLFKNFDNDLLPKEYYKVKGGDTYLAGWQSQFGKTKYLDFISSAYRIHDGGVYSSLSSFETAIHSLGTRVGLIKIFPKHKKVQNEIYKYFRAAGENLQTFNQTIIYSRYYILLLKLHENNSIANITKMFFINIIEYKKRTIKSYIKFLIS